MIYNRARILVAEDSQLNRTMLARNLKQQGHTVTLAADGRQALELVQSQEFDMLLLDIMMPEMDGYQVLEYLQNHNTLRELPVVVISVVDEMDSIVKCIEMGAEDYLIKPFDPVLLQARVGVCLEKKRLRDQERAYFKQLQQHNSALSELNRLGQQLSAMLDMQQITRHLPRATAEIIGAQGASVWLWDEQREGWLICRAVHHPGLTPSALLNLSLRPGEGVAGWVAHHGQSIVVPNTYQDQRFFAGIDEQTGFQTTSLLAVPLRVHYAVIGVLEIVNKLQGDFNSDDLTLVETLAVSAAIAIDNAVLFDARRQLVNELKARNEELDAFAHTVAHDLKGAINNITGYADMVKDNYHRMSDEQRTLSLQMVSQSGYRMASVVDELLLLTSVRKMEVVEMQVLDMASIVGHARDRLAYMTDASQAEIILPDEWPVALGYGPWVEEIWVNYISNAIKYGGKPPRVELGATLQEDGMTRFWVHDNGEGLVPEDQQRLFMPFERLHQLKGEGQGLGLSIVRRITDKLGGQVGIESQPGQGSTFSFTLPSQELSQSIVITQSNWGGQSRAAQP